MGASVCSEMGHGATHLKKGNQRLILDNQDRAARKFTHRGQPFLSVSLRDGLGQYNGCVCVQIFMGLSQCQHMQFSKGRALTSF